MKYCKHCGSEIVSNQKVCTQCGTKLDIDTHLVPPFQKEPKKSKKISIILSLIVVVLIISVIAAFLVLKHQLSPEKDADQIVQAIKHKDAKTLSHYLTTKDKHLTVEESKAFIDLLNQNEQLDSYADKIGKAILEAKKGHSNGAIVSTELKTQLFSAEKRDKKYLVFDHYVYEVPQLNVAMYSENEGTLTYTHNNKDHKIELKKNSVVDLGNFTMGNYEIPAVKKVNGEARKGKLYLNMSGVRTIVKESFGEKRVTISKIENSSKFDRDDIHIYINDKNQGAYDSSKTFGPFSANEDVSIYAIGKYDKDKSFKTNIVNLKNFKGNEVLNGLVEMTLKFNDKEIEDYIKNKEKDNDDKEDKSTDDNEKSDDNSEQKASSDSADNDEQDSTTKHKSEHHSDEDDGTKHFDDNKVNKETSEKVMSKIKEYEKEKGYSDLKKYHAKDVERFNTFTFKVKLVDDKGKLVYVYYVYDTGDVSEEDAHGFAAHNF